MGRAQPPRVVAAQRTAVALALALFLAPVAWLFSTAWKPARDIFSFPPSLAFTPTWDNFRTIFAFFDVPQLLQNSVIISGGTTLLSLVLGVPCGYALARARVRWAAGLAYFFLAVRMVPPVATLIPFYLLMRDLGLLGSYGAVILLDTTLNTAFVVWMMFSWFRSVPPEIEQAAMADGATQFGAFWRIAVPMVVPGIVASALLCFMLSWNSFLFPAFLTTADTKTLSVALLTAYGTKEITWGTMGALAHFSTLPIVALALVLNRYFVQGLTRGFH
ncbi:MAG: carbohydrate ABC transporter permease [Alphaproteobacteria bacterium]